MNSIINKIVYFDRFLQTNNGLKTILIVIVLINSGLYINSLNTNYTSEEMRQDAAGFSPDKAHKFAYFYYYTGHFPLATLNADLEYSKEGADNEISERGSDLIMEYQHWSRLGEHARILAFLPNAYVKGSPENPSIKLFNGLVFTLALLILFFGFWNIKKPLIGLILCFLVNFTPFFLYEIYSHENIFGLLGSVFFMILGLNIYMLFCESQNFLKSILIAVLSGVIVGFFSEFRNEISIVIVSLVLMYLLSKRMKIAQKMIIILTTIFFFNSSKTFIRNEFNLKFEKTSQLVGIQGGHVYNGAKITGHNFWHPVFCGLGDFDTKYGYQWYDIVAYKYAIPILNKKYGMNIHYTQGKYYTDDYYDDAGLYYKKPEELKNYDNVLKEKVLSDIKRDPFWYISILVKRVYETLTVTIPVSNVGLLLLPLVYFLIRRKTWGWLKVIVVSLPLSATSIIVYSGKGTTYNSLFVYFVIIVIFSLLYEYLKKRSNVEG